MAATVELPSWGGGSWAILTKDRRHSAVLSEDPREQLLRGPPRNCNKVSPPACPCALPPRAKAGPRTDPFHLLERQSASSPSCRRQLPANYRRLYEHAACSKLHQETPPKNNCRQRRQRVERRSQVSVRLRATLQAAARRELTQRLVQFRADRGICRPRSWQHKGAWS